MGTKLLVCILLFLVSCTAIPFVKIGDLVIEVEIAKTFEEKQRGLMFRESMPSNHGMIFLFDDARPRSFWMKNTKIPLDMVFIYANLTVESIMTAVPCTNDPCPLYNSGPNVQYVLEVNANLSKDWRRGQKVELRGIS